MSLVTGPSSWLGAEFARGRRQATSVDRVMLSDGKIKKNVRQLVLRTACGIKIRCSARLPFRAGAQSHQ
jgi:hypothetical protein